MKEIAVSLWEAVRETRWFFTPFDAKKWVAVAVAAVFVGARAGYTSVTNLALVPFLPSVSAESIERAPTSANEAVSPAAVALADSIDFLAVGIVALTVATFLGSVAEFVLIDVLRTGEPRLRRFLMDRFGAGIHLFLFRIVVTASLFGVAALVGIGAVGGFGPVALAVLLPIFAFSVVASIINGLTTDFVVPVMMVDDCGVLKGWKEFFPVLTENPATFLVYVVGRLLVNLAVAVGFAVSSVVIGVLLGLPVAVTGYAVSLTEGGFDAVLASALGVALLVVVVVLYVLLLVALVALFLQLPVRLFFRSWPLYLLGRVEEEYEILDEPPETVFSLRPPS